MNMFVVVQLAKYLKKLRMMIKMEKECENRFCKKMVDVGDCYSYTPMGGEKVFWCNERCYKEHIGAIDPLE